MYVFEKTTSTFGTFALLYTITETFILPLTPSPDQSFAKSLLDLALPFMVAYLLLFYIIFGSSTIVYPVQSMSERKFFEQNASVTDLPSFHSQLYPVYGIAMPLTILT